MICFCGRTFCSSERHRPDCDRRWTAELAAAAERWWGGPDAPVSFAPLCDEPASSGGEPDGAPLTDFDAPAVSAAVVSAPDGRPVETRRHLPRGARGRKPEMTT